MINIGSVFLGISLSSFLYYSGLAVPQEILLPLLYLYHILTFSLAYPEAHLIRRLFVSFGLSFADLFVTVCLFQKDWPEKLWVWVSEFVVVYIMVASLTHTEISYGLAGKFIRTVIYTGSGYIKAVSLVSSLVYLSSSYPPTELVGFLLHVGLGVSKLGSTVAVYYADRLIWSDSFFHSNTMNEIYRRLKYSLIPVCLIIEMCALFPIEKNLNASTSALDYQYLYNTTSSYHYFVGCCYMISWYLNEAHEYGLKLRQR